MKQFQIHIGRPLPVEVESDSSERILGLYALLHETQRYEGEGIWSRFNIMLSTNTLLFAAFAFLFAKKPEGWQSVAVMAAAVGFLHCAWAAYVLRRLWMWHGHWLKLIADIEATFPVGWPRPLMDRPSSLTKKASTLRVWTSEYTQPFVAILAVSWIVAGCLAIVSVPAKTGSPGPLDRGPTKVAPTARTRPTPNPGASVEGQR